MSLSRVLIQTEDPVELVRPLVIVHHLLGLSDIDLISLFALSDEDVGKQAFDFADGDRQRSVRLRVAVNHHFPAVHQFPPVDRRTVEIISSHVGDGHVLDDALILLVVLNRLLPLDDGQLRVPFLCQPVGVEVEGVGVKLG